MEIKVWDIKLVKINTCESFKFKEDIFLEIGRLDAIRDNEKDDTDFLRFRDFKLVEFPLLSKFESS